MKVRGRKRQRGKTERGALVACELFNNTAQQPVPCNVPSMEDAASPPPKRTRTPVDQGRYGSMHSTIAKAMSRAKDSVEDCQRALDLLGIRPIPSPKFSYGTDLAVCNGDKGLPALQIPNAPPELYSDSPMAVTPLQSVQGSPVTPLKSKPVAHFAMAPLQSSPVYIQLDQQKVHEIVDLSSPSPELLEGKTSDHGDPFSDYELEEDPSDHETEPDCEVDPLEDMWKELAISQQFESDGHRNNKHVVEEQRDEGCTHSFVLTLEVGRACTHCGLIREHIEHMSFLWRKPRQTRNNSGHAGPLGRDLIWGDTIGSEEPEERLEGTPELKVHPTLEEVMHPHQREGFRFLSRNLVEQDAGGCMLAFAPGTGKSFLIISFLQSFLTKKPDAKPMIVAPKGMLFPWVREFKKWEVEHIPTFVLYEANSSVDNQLNMLQKWQQSKSVLLVGYSQFTNMGGEVGKLLTEGPGLLILDEGHLARTSDTKILKALTQVRTKRKVLLSGTPFNNNFEEFYNTLELVRPDFMRQAAPQLSTPHSKKQGGDVGRQYFKYVIVERIESKNPEVVMKTVLQLRAMISPFVLWHKGQVLSSLPGISDFTIMVHLTPIQQRLLALSEKNENKDYLQKRAAAIYVHPILEKEVENHRRTQDDPRLNGDINIREGVKLRWVLDLVGLCEAAGEKLLIFSEYLYCLKLIENMISRRTGWSRGVQIIRLDGKLQPEEREERMDHFNTGSEARVLCASIKACGEGISLIGASRVVLLEVPWNPAVSRQAISRAFRIGQQKRVVVYRLVAADTQEETKMHDSSTRKEWLSKLLFDHSTAAEGYTSMLWDVKGKCNDRFLNPGPLLDGVRNVYERQF